MTAGPFSKQLAFPIVWLLILPKVQKCSKKKISVCFLSVKNIFPGAKYLKNKHLFEIFMHILCTGFYYKCLTKFVSSFNNHLKLGYYY